MGVCGCVCGALCGTCVYVHVCMVYRCVGHVCFHVWYMYGTLCGTCACVCVRVYGVLCVLICVSGACVVHGHGKLCGACMCVFMCVWV